MCRRSAIHSVGRASLVDVAVRKTVCVVIDNSAIDSGDTSNFHRNTGAKKGVGCAFSLLWMLKLTRFRGFLSF